MTVSRINVGHDSIQVGSAVKWVIWVKGFCKLNFIKIKPTMCKPVRNDKLSVRVWVFIQLGNKLWRYTIKIQVTHKWSHVKHRFRTKSSQVSLCISVELCTQNGETTTEERWVPETTATEQLLAYYWCLWLWTYH